MAFEITDDELNTIVIDNDKILRAQIAVCVAVLDELKGENKIGGEKK